MAKCNGPFFKEVAKRKKQGRDVKITISARDGATGVGKTACGVCLMKYLHTARVPFDAEVNATLHIPRFNSMYDELPIGSSAILDEAEQLDARRSNATENVETARTWEVGRIREIASCLILPSVAELDSRMERLHDFWINVTARGEARIYEAKVHDFKKIPYYRHMQNFRWPNMDDDPDYQALADMKEEFIGPDGSRGKWVLEDEVREEYERKIEEKERDMRDRIISSMYERTDLTQEQVGQALPEEYRLKQQRVGQIVNG